jgi:ATP-dependent Clp protease adaptor protein ClpS
MIDEKTELSTTTIDDLLNEKKLVLYNDNHNSFQYVMLALSSVLNYTLEQSEQISLIVHNRGKAVIKTGEYLSLKNYYEQLKQLDLTLKIE